MRIGIMSMQRIRNYGSFLQAFGLKRILETLGGEVVYVDYQVQDELVKPNQTFDSHTKVGKNVFKLLRKKVYIHRFNKIFNQTI